MSRLQKIMVLTRAFSRLSPRMAVYMARRVARNKLARHLPRSYAARLARIEAGLPRLAPGIGPESVTPASRDDLVTPGLRAMSDFYCAEYRHMLEGSLSGKITLHNRTVDFGSPANVDWHHYLPEETDHQMWRVKLGHMGFLCPMMLEGGPDHHTAIADYVASARAGVKPSDPGAFNAFWFPYGASHRMLAVGAGLLVARRTIPLPPEIDAAVVELLRHTAAFVLDNIEHELCNNHVERNLAALCLYFSYAEYVPPAIAARLERDITHLMDKTMLADGSQIERSPMYQGLSVASLSVMAEAPFLSEGLRANLGDLHERASRAFAILCQPDGEVALFNDAWHGEVPRLSGAPAPDGRHLLEQGGYGRLAQGSDLCLMDAGALGPRWNPGHGHADFLSLELTLDGRRVVVDPGTSRYNTGAERAWERSAAAHNGPVWQGHEPVDFYGCFKVGRLAEAMLVAGAKLPQDQMVGIFRNGPGTLARAVQHVPGQGYLVADLWSGTVPQGQVTWLVPGGWSHQAVDGQHLLTQDAGRAAIVPLVAQGATQVTDCVWSHHYGQLERAHALRLIPVTAGGRQRLATWIGHGPAPDDAEERAQALFDTLAGLT